ncbi:MAG: hypothetical protein R3219_02490 [Hydrogenovibrio sp.]|nr:hypothetical protein [Hydrogenovibrio sp.]
MEHPDEAPHKIASHKKSTLFLLSAWTMGITGLILGLAISPDWFARFGSVMVLFAVMSEYTLIHFEFTQLYKNLDAIKSHENIPDLSPSKWHRKKVWFSHLTVIIGTGIWGFGDLLHML